MTDLKGNTEFCFSDILNVPFGFASGNIEGLGEKNSVFLVGPVTKCFVIPPNSKIEQIMP